MTLVPSLLYLVYREALSSVFPSQVLTPLAEHRRYGPVSLGIHTPVGHLCRSKYRPALNTIDHRARQAGIGIGWIPSPPSRTPWLWSDAWMLRQWVLKRFGREAPLVVRCRNAAMTCIATKALHGFENVRIIFDCRGAEIIELVQQLGVENVPAEQWTSKQREAIELARRREEIAVTQSAGITCVSQAMVRSLQQRYPQLSDDKFRVVPCCPDVDSFQSALPQRDAVREELGLSDRYVVTYLGSLVWYQQPEASLRVFRAIHRLRSDAHFLAITTEPDKMRRLAQQAEIPEACVTIKSLPAREVPRYLVASDVALMLRDQSETNRVASPVKFGEYLAAGVPVIITPGLGDASGLVENEYLGQLVDLNEEDSRLIERLRSLTAATLHLRTELRNRCSTSARQHFSWANIVPRLTDWYRELPQPSRNKKLDNALSTMESCR